MLPSRLTLTVMVSLYLATVFCPQEPHVPKATLPLCLAARVARSKKVRILPCPHAREVGRSQIFPFSSMTV